MQTCFYAKQLWEGLTRVTLPGGVYSYVAEGPERAMVIDTGCGLGDYRAFAEQLLKGKPYEVILTHGHVDHAGGAAQFERVWLHERDWPLAAEHTQREIRAGYLRSMQAESEIPPISDEMLCPPMVDGYLRLLPGQIFDLGTEELEIVPLYGHTKGSVGVLFRRAQALLSGDACCSMTLLFDRTVSLGIWEYQESVRAAAAYCDGRVKQMLYSHPHNRGGVEILQDMIALCDDVLAGRDAGLENRGNFLARQMNADLMPLDGGIANLVYAPQALEE